MPRRARWDAPGAVHHILLRGVAQADIVADDVDRFAFVARLTRLIPEEEVRCYAWALMSNHAHLVVRTGSTPISRLMARLGTSYAQHFNRRHGRVGHLFQNRFKSVPVLTQSHAESLVRYVHRNPLEAGIVASVAALESYRWTGYPELMGERAAPLIDCAEVHSWFGLSPDSARGALRRWMHSEEGSRGGSDQARIQEADFAPVPAASSGGTQPEVGASIRIPSENQPLAELLDRVCRATGATQVDVLSGARDRLTSRARAILIYRARIDLKMATNEIEGCLGLSRGAGTRAIQRARRLSMDDAKI